MQTNIHPKWNTETKVTCACGNTFTLGSTKDSIEVEICSACHPFFTGQMKYVDTAGRVDSFIEKQKKAKKNVLSKAERRKLKRQKQIEDEISRPESLKDLQKSDIGKSIKKASKKQKKADAN